MSSGQRKTAQADNGLGSQPSLFGHDSQEGERTASGRRRSPVALEEALPKSEQSVHPPTKQGRGRVHLARNLFANWGGWFPAKDDWDLFMMLPEWRRQEILRSRRQLADDESGAVV